MAHPASYWVALILIGGLAGGIGQVARMIVGLKKMNEDAAAKNIPPSDLIEPSRMFMSLIIGFTAGALAAVTLADESGNVTAQQFFGFAGAGYSGTDFIEGLMSRLIPQAGAPTVTNTNIGAAAPVAARSDSATEDYLG